MATLVTSYSSQIGHITDDTNRDTIKTRCGRTIQYFSLRGGYEDCPKCGSPNDFENVRQEMEQCENKKHAAAIAAMQRENEIKARRLAAHREIMRKLQSMLKDAGVNITLVKELPAGGEIEFTVDKLNFRLTGSIW